VKQKRFTVEQIVAVLKQAEAGVPLAELIRRVGISEQTFYRWKKQYVGLQVDQVRQLKQLQEENTRLKELVADLTLDKAMLQDVLSKKFLRPTRRRQVVEYPHGSYRVSERHACRVARLNRGTFRYRGHKDRKRHPETVLTKSGISPHSHFETLPPNLWIVAIINIHAGVAAMKTLWRSIPNG